jgi:histidyl-tRNA synthetase
MLKESRHWDRSMKKPAKVLYVGRAHRYDSPQRGRYREFTQFGVEILGNAPGDCQAAIRSLRACLDAVEIDYRFCDSVKRGLGYYVTTVSRRNVRRSGHRSR